ncbi:MAG: entericidin A/B family lipoprotein [Rhodospirillaceae bacterium]|nr:entericidin A/B family lipoprotein [Rhodospirillales bacterium]
MRQTSTTITARQRGSSLLLLAALMLISVLAVSGCNTVSGMGEDLSAAGQGIDRSSESTQDQLTDKPQSRTQQQRDSDYQAGRY